MQSAAKPRTRVYCPELREAEAELVLDARAAHKLRAVLRAKAGERLTLFNGIQGAWLAELSEVERKAVRVRLLEQLAAPRRESALRLCFAPIKRQGLAWMLEKACELGVTQLQPVLTRYAQRDGLRMDKLEMALIDATEQSERFEPPRLAAPLSLAELLAGLDAPLLACLEQGESLPLAQVLESGSVAASLLIGPEGGFAPEEVEALVADARVQPVGLGPRILRAETAAVAALSLWQALSSQGDGAQPPRLPA